MTTDAARSMFLKQLDEAQRQPQRVGESEIARMARKAGLSLQDSLREMRRSTPYRQEGNSDAYDALVAFVTRLCRQAKSPRILEYARLPSLVTASSAESDVPMSCVVPDIHVAEPLRILFENRSASILNTINDLPPGAQFDVIACQPAIGHRPAGNDNADGFGGEVIRDLAPFLAKSGTLCWITARGALTAPGGKKTLSACPSSKYLRQASSLANGGSGSSLV